ncbi:hypothetical protein Fot_29609 [Forsythia ovata]|uniref:Uncharacterized protein n=1 Tax=Forsythia ovata TaxID=205694 RepID=A0ABD1TSD5_9LAMI
MVGMKLLRGDCSDYNFQTAPVFPIIRGVPSTSCLAWEVDSPQVKRWKGEGYGGEILKAKGIVEVAGGGFSSPAMKCKKDGNFTNYEPISVLVTRSPSPSTSTSTFSSFNNSTQ